MNQEDKIEESINKEWEKLRELMMDFYRGDADFEEIMLSFKVWARQFNKELATQIKTQEREQIKTDLLKIADDGEIEDLRREVVRYFV